MKHSIELYLQLSEGPNGTERYRLDRRKYNLNRMNCSFFLNCSGVDGVNSNNLEYYEDDIMKHWEAEIL